MIIKCSCDNIWEGRTDPEKEFSVRVSLVKMSLMVYDSIACTSGQFLTDMRCYITGQSLESNK